jgi:hypothetical protein
MALANAYEKATQLHTRKHILTPEMLVPRSKKNINKEVEVRTADRKPSGR